MTRLIMSGLLAFGCLPAAVPDTATAWIEALGGEVVRDARGNIVEVSLARTWATDSDVERVAQIAGLKRLDLSFTYVTDRGIERLQQLQDLEELNLDTAEFLSDAAASHLRANRKLRKLVLRGVDITDVGIPFIASLTGLKSLDLNHTMIGDVGIEALSALTEIEELNLGANRITGLNFHIFRLLPKLRKLSFGGLQRRNGNVCWTPTITDADLGPISMLAGLEELHLEIGLNLGTFGVARRENNCQATGGGIQITDAGLAKLSKLKSLRRLDIGGHKITPAGLDALKSLPRLERLSLWNCTELTDSAASVLTALPSLSNLDLSLTAVGDSSLPQLAKLSKLKYLYLTDTKVTPNAVQALRKEKPDVFISWGSTASKHRGKTAMKSRIAAMFAFSGSLMAQVSDPSYFTSKVYPVLEAAQCRGCHSRDGVASGTRLHFPEGDAAQARIQAFGLSLAPLKSLLLSKPTGRIAHTGGERIRPGSEEEKALAQWLDYLGTLSEESLATLRNRPAPDSARSKPFVRRLTHTQYNNTVRDLLGDVSQPASRFPPEDYVDGFKNQFSMQGAPPLLVEAYATTAEKLALNAFRAGDLNGLVPCRPASANDQKCRDQFIRAFGLRAFRYPLRDAELQRYAAAFSAQARTSGKFLEGARAVVEAMLQSPKFLFHVQPDDYGVASRLSYLLWNTMPDKALLDAAANGELRTAAGRERWARRMLENPLARPAIDEFFVQWLRLDRVPNLTKERRLYPEFTPELAAAMVEETRLLFQHLVWENGNFMDALRADYGFLNPELASTYRIPAPASPFELVRFPPGTERAGLLGHGSILAATAGPAATSPTARGVFIREQLLCQQVPPPPPDVDTTLPELSENMPLTRRQRMTAHAENPVCASCHKLMDPIGFGLESFDAIGRWREKESVQTSRRVDLALNTKGEIAGLPNSAFSNSIELGRILADSPVCQECIARQVFRYAYGRREGAADQETVRALFASFRDSGFRFKELWIAAVRSPEFVRGLNSLDNKMDASGR